MKIEDLRIGQTVQIVADYKYSEWNNEIVTIIGLDTERGENISIKDKHDDKYDGFKSQDFVDDKCPDCGRTKAKDAYDCGMGLCPKWYAIRDADAEHDCQISAKASI